jgi:hypothetical protein
MAQGTLKTCSVFSIIRVAVEDVFFLQTKDFGFVSD